MFSDTDHHRHKLWRPEVLLKLTPRLWKVMSLNSNTIYNYASKGEEAPVTAREYRPGTGECRQHDSTRRGWPVEKKHINVRENSASKRSSQRKRKAEWWKATCENLDTLTTVPTLELSTLPWKNTHTNRQLHGHTDSSMRLLLCTCASRGPWFTPDAQTHPASEETGFERGWEEEGEVGAKWRQAGWMD